MYQEHISFSTSLNLEATLFCGQAFRWRKANTLHNKIYNGIIYGHAITITQRNAHELLITSKNDPYIGNKALRDAVITYLGLSDSCKGLFDNTPLLEKYPFMNQARALYGGLKLLRQEPFEALISFMCAQGMGIQIIRRQIEQLARQFGEKINDSPPFDSEHCYSFPSPQALANADIELLKKCTNNNLVRAKNIKHISEAVVNGELVLEHIHAIHNENLGLCSKCSYKKAKAALLRFPGIGDKIADCICLFGLEHGEAIPIDRHVRMYLYEWFGLKTVTAALNSKNYEQLASEARELFGSSCPGLLSQILFHFWRLHVKGLRTV
ncbi:8-oxoguanine DNA glycosylase domain protein [Chloroherpeton thalassium ATCC 35110]|uniref:DNA-(apurinic or apyrimidinic site) lyase n=1 Tax=Chloroherpeton thalassium (strain ATCC 35110 / GB-78) TaxID=517418 RepID=B3QVZ3_CHLT3|nr:DNA glycosylase [Chloroherpeton thalassium]ACF14647.1 8-oxoguanine DNA glycosylase domain protein [Chloroherpeton thalassium ATCC 35110]